MRRRIVTMTVLVALLSMALFAIPLGVGLSYYYRTQERDSVQRIAYAVAAAAPDNLAAGNQLAELKHLSKDDRVGIYDDKATLVSGTGNAGGLRLVRQALAGSTARGVIDGRVAVAVPVGDTGEVTGAVLATAATHDIRQAIIVWTSLIALAALALVVTRLVARREAAGLARPLEQLSARAERLGNDGLGGQTAAYGIAEIDSLARSMANASARIDLLIERERALAREASHQLRTPLTTLSLTLDAASEAADPTQGIRAAQAIAARLDQTVTDMLQIVRVGGATEILDIDALLEHVVARWQIANSDPRRALRVEVEQDAPPGAMSAHAARQILDVLIDNAAHHGEGDVMVAVRSAGSALAIDVSQAGGSLEYGAADLFAGTDTRGTGLGLPLARAIAQSEGARLVLTSANPVTFAVVMPSSVEKEAGTERI